MNDFWVMAAMIRLQMESVEYGRDRRIVDCA